MQSLTLACLTTVGTTVTASHGQYYYARVYDGECRTMFGEKPGDPPGIFLTGVQE
jgi:hypothetical protein